MYKLLYYVNKKNNNQIFQEGFLPIFMTIMFVFVHGIPLTVSTGLYIRTAYFLFTHHPPANLYSEYTHWTKTRRATLRVSKFFLLTRQLSSFNSIHKTRQEISITISTT